MTQFSALQTARSVRTRRLAAAEENVEVARAARLAQILKEICDGIISYKGVRGPQMAPRGCSKHARPSPPLKASRTQNK